MMKNSNGGDPAKHDSHYLTTISDTEVLSYIYDLVDEIETMCDKRGFSELQPHFAKVKEIIAADR